MDIETIEMLFVRALGDEGFTRHGTRMGTWDISRNCDKPVPVTLHSRKTGLLRKVRLRKVPPGIELVLLTPCRRCRVCLARHAALWRFRALNELAESERTWFATLTAEPSEHTRLDHVAATSNGDFWNLPPGKKFAARNKAIGAEVTKYLKRLREDSGHRFRYLCVTEVHDGEDTSDFMRGRPHMHMLLHEFPGQPLRKEMLERQWKLGFSSFKLASGPKAAWYVSKYISKAVDARVRASQRYGKL